MLVFGLGLYQFWLICLVYPQALGVDLPQGRLQVLAVPVLRGSLATWAVCFPLGLVYGLKSPVLLPLLRRLRWPVFAVTAGLFTIDLLGPHELPSPASCIRLSS